MAAFALFVLQEDPLQGPMNEERLKATHKAIFGELYDWAGAYRENIGTMTKGRVAGYRVTYGNSRFVPVEMSRIFRELAAESYLSGLDIDKIAVRLAYYYSEIDSTHPFREGNSRTLRQFFADLALATGFELDWEPSGRTPESIRALYVARDSAFTQRNYVPLTRIIRSSLSPLSR